jgi:hypothetical protein
MKAGHWLTLGLGLVLSPLAACREGGEPCAAAGDSEDCLNPRPDDFPVNDGNDSVAGGAGGSAGSADDNGGALGGSAGNAMSGSGGDAGAELAEPPRSRLDAGVPPVDAGSLDAGADAAGND